MQNDSDGKREDRAQPNSGLRLDVVIAVCALLISSLASAASWWQARLLNEQTQVLHEQLGAQIWPYVDVTESIDNGTVTVMVDNDGLGPAIIRSEVARVDGVTKSSMVDVLHGVLGPDLLKRIPHGEKIRLTVDGNSPGSVLRSGASFALMTLTSKRFAAPLVHAFKRVSFQVCYCAIVPGQCWFVDSATTADPRPQPACHEVSNDLMHTSPLDELEASY